METIKLTLGRIPCAFLLAAALSFLFFRAGSLPDWATTEVLARQVALSTMMFLLLFFFFHSFSSGVRRQFVRERNIRKSQMSNQFLLWLFVLYKESIKTIFGVGLTLCWLAGLIYISERCGDLFILLPAFLGLLHSAVVLLPAFLFASLLDHIHYPRKG